MSTELFRGNSFNTEILASVHIRNLRSSKRFWNLNVPKLWSKFVTIRPGPPRSVQSFSKIKEIIHLSVLVTCTPETQSSTICSKNSLHHCLARAVNIKSQIRRRSIAGINWIANQLTQFHWLWTEHFPGFCSWRRRIIEGNLVVLERAQILFYNYNL